MGVTQSQTHGFEEDAASIPDAALLVAVGNGDQSAARILIARLGPRLLRHTARMLGDRAEAEDVVQDTFLRLWRIAPDWRQGEAQVSTWAFRVAINLATDKLRARRPIVPIDTVADPVAPLVGAVERMTEAQRLSALDKALDTLPDRQRQAVALRHIEEMSNPEIAEIMDISVEAVESLTARGKRALTAALQGQKQALGFQDDA